MRGTYRGHGSSRGGHSEREPRSGGQRRYEDRSRRQVNHGREEEPVYRIPRNPLFLPENQGSDVRARPSLAPYSVGVDSPANLRNFTPHSSDLSSALNKHPRENRHVEGLRPAWSRRSNLSYDFSESEFERNHCQCQCCQTMDKKLRDYQSIECACCKQGIGFQSRKNKELMFCCSGCVVNSKQYTPPEENDLLNPGEGQTLPFPFVSVRKLVSLSSQPLATRDVVDKREIPFDKQIAKPGTSQASRQKAEIFDSSSNSIQGNRHPFLVPRDQPGLGRNPANSAQVKPRQSELIMNLNLRKGRNAYKKDVEVERKPSNGSNLTRTVDPVDLEEAPVVPGVIPPKVILESPSMKKTKTPLVVRRGDDLQGTVRAEGTILEKRVRNIEDVEYSKNLVGGSRVRISFIWSKCRYLVTSALDEEAAENVQRKIANSIQKNEYEAVESPLRIGDIVLGPYGGDYYRGHVLKISGSAVELEFLDYGDRATVKFCELKHLDDFLFQEPLYSIDVLLDGVDDAAKGVVNDEVLEMEMTMNFHDDGPKHNSLVNLWPSKHSSLNDLFNGKKKL